ncbi:Osmosensitive K+ channel histidine kinase KdpD [Rubrivivax sp. A210]|uniref:sensor histidine kinase n=1 Tax=Rubrivivax sp. A210 TaxID=2772301 RepID=UPI001918BCBA|nr:ATP-binding protein [Rubrivivax sp. A210]CAD5371822.1 Osmosensitive K+ channel histidine kinase KdpD [Rubrivivax sp. A210]
MTVRFRLALTVFLTGLATALGVIATVVVAFQRFEHENSYQRADAFLTRVLAAHGDLLDLHQRDPEAFAAFLRNLLLYEPDSQLYLLDADGRVLASTGRAQLAPGYRVALLPVQQAAEAAAAGDRQRAAYVMGDDPEYMDADAVVAARALRRAVIRAQPGAAGYLYLVCRKGGEPATRWALARSSLGRPALAAVLAVVLLASALAAWIIVTVTRPLRVLSDEVAAAARAGFDADAALADASPTGLQAQPPAGDDEFARLRRGFHGLMQRLRAQWDALRRLDHFRREGVSNLSHDLRSPLTATVACLETLDARWQGDAARDEDRRLVEVALRNTRNAAAMVRSLGDLAQLDEPAFHLQTLRLDLAEVLDDIALRFADRAAAQGVALGFEQLGEAAPVAEVDIELIERAVANLLDNALKHTPAGGSVKLAARREGDGGGHSGGHSDSDRVVVTVQDSGCGIAAAELPLLFDRLYQARHSVAPASSDEGRGLGLAIVKRIVELHHGTVAVASAPGAGTTVTLAWPVRQGGPA